MSPFEEDVPADFAAGSSAHLSSSTRTYDAILPPQWYANAGLYAHITADEDLLIQRVSRDCDHKHDVMKSRLQSEL